MYLTADEVAFLDLIHEENFEKDYEEWIAHMEEQYSEINSLTEKVAI